MTANRIGASSSGAFATARRGGLTAYEIAQAEQLSARRVSVQNIAMQLGRSMQDVQAILNPPPRAEQSQPLPPAPSPIVHKSVDPQRDAIIRRMWTAGYPIRDIAQEAECSTSTVKIVRLRLALPPRNNPALTGEGWSEAEDAYIRARYLEKGETAESVARTMGRTRNAVIGRAHRMELKRQDATGPQHIRGPLADGLRSIRLGSIADEVEAG